MIQFVSKLWLPSNDKDCSQRAAEGVMSFQSKRTLIARPPKTSSHPNQPEGCNYRDPAADLVSFETGVQFIDGASSQTGLTAPTRPGPIEDWRANPERPPLNFEWLPSDASATSGAFPRTGRALVRRQVQMPCSRA